MSNTNRDHTTEGRDPNDPGFRTVAPPQRPAADDTGHVSGSATEMAELARALQPESGGKNNTRNGEPGA